ncbi:thrombopoietin isoform X2 [Antennarius striatus]|uniref:thrombopoietin isoform X2 n=1 Tax=Antennarius striatus TaxID=241820 RepID=UPI0035B4D205
MAVHQSSPLCPPPGLLLLLIGVISSHLPEIQARPADFWCNSQARKNMGNKIEGLKKDTADCVGSDLLSSPVQIPCVWIHVAEWANKTLQQKREEVVGSLQMFQDGVLRVMNETRLQCQTSRLREVGHHISNYLAIVSRLQIQEDQVMPPDSTVQRCSSQTSLNKVLELFRMLLKGKLERLAIDLQDGICRA